MWLFLKFHDKSLNAFVHALPLSPRLVLIGKQECGVQIPQFKETVIQTAALTQDEAEYLVQAICLSAITAIACKSNSYDVLALRQSAVARGICFAKIKNLEAVLSAGTKEFKGLMLMLTTKEEYTKFMKSFIHQGYDHGEPQ